MRTVSRIRYEALVDKNKRLYKKNEDLRKIIETNDIKKEFLKDLEDKDIQIAKLKSTLIDIEEKAQSVFIDLEFDKEKNEP